ncbi:hypothetical protein BAY61_22920 [Prauserella marina]|nr:hypothetical protein BAY61_22920 [Prauserella marina]
MLLGVSFLVFVTVDLSPNDPAMAKMGLFSDPESRARFAEENGLNDPLPVRFWRFLTELVHFRLGDSVAHSESVNTLIGMAFPVTLQLVVFATVIAVTVSLLIGTIAARSDGRMVDRTIGTAAAIMQASPPFWVGLLFIQVFAVALGVLPSGGYVPMQQGFSYWFSSIIGPAVVLSLPFTAALTRVVRASMADELAKDYVRTAIGAGVAWRVVIFRNVLRNALITPITVIGVYVGALMSGAVLVEVVFNLPGMGTLLVTAVNNSDLGVVRGVAIVGATTFVVVNLVVDIVQMLLNPRSVEASNG